ncbi:hypothetical protein EMCRGX_G010217 [Ephydatia muelleri]
MPSSGSQLDRVDGILCRKYQPGPASDTIAVLCCQNTVPEGPEHVPQLTSSSHQGTQKTLKDTMYLLVIQDYFTKWADARLLPDQTAIRITAELVKLFCTYSVPEIVNLDQGQNFESSIVQSTRNAFGVKFNNSLLQLLQTYVERQEDWEQYLPLALYAYRTSTHSTTGVSPFQLMYDRHPQPNILTPSRGYGATSYQAVLQAKMAELQDLVEAHIAESAHRQKVDYDRHSEERQFKGGDLVWLSVPTAGKLDPRWEGNWTVRSVKSPVTMEISDGDRTKVGAHQPSSLTNPARNPPSLSDTSKQQCTDMGVTWSRPLCGVHSTG